MSYGSRKRGLWPAGSVRGEGLSPLRCITSSPSQTLRPCLVRRTPRWVLDACRRPSRLCFTHFAARTVDDTVDVYAAKPDIPPQSHYCLPHLHSTPPLEEFPSKYCHAVWYGKTRMVWLPDGEKISKIVFSQKSRTWRSERRTDRHRMTT